MNFLRVDNISKSTKNGFSLKEISFEIAPLKRLAIAGETGSGKSTLLKIIAGLAQKDTGEILFEDKRVKGPEEQLLPGHPGIAYLSQHYELRNHYRVEELLDMANKLSDTAAAAIYEVCRITHLLKRKTDELSGGERQRIALAGLLTTSPKLLLLDEPFSNLDPIHKSLLKAVIEDIGDKLQITCILASHDPVDTLSWADEILVLKDGLLLQEGTPAAIYSQPVDAYVAGLFGTYNYIPRERIFALFSIVIDKPVGKELLIRPENFKLSKIPAAGAVAGEVNKVRFFGNYSLLEINVGGLSVTAAADGQYFQVNDGVYVSLTTDNVWFV